MGTTFDGVDGVGEGVDGFAVATVPLHSDLNFVSIVLRLEPENAGVDGSLGFVEGLDVVLQTVGVVVFAFAGCFSAGFFSFLFRLNFFFSFGGFSNLGVVAGFCFRIQFGLFFGNAFVHQGDGESFVEERHFLEAAGDDVEAKCGGFENVPVRPEADRGAGSFGGAFINELVGDGVGEVLDVFVSVASNFCFDSRGEGVHNRDTDAVETTGDGVGFGVEFAAGVQLGHDNLHGG